MYSKSMFGIGVGMRLLMGLSNPQKLIVYNIER